MDERQLHPTGGGAFAITDYNDANAMTLGATRAAATLSRGSPLEGADGNTAATRARKTSSARDKLT